MNAHGYRDVGRVKPRIVFADPPDRERQPQEIDWQHVADTLRSRPGRWACITLPAGRYLKNTTARNIAGNQVFAPFRPAGSFEAVVRSGSLYARYVAEQEAPLT